MARRACRPAAPHSFATDLGGVPPLASALDTPFGSWAGPIALAGPSRIAPLPPQQRDSSDAITLLTGLRTIGMTLGTAGVIVGVGEIVDGGSSRAGGVTGAGPAPGTPTAGTPANGGPVVGAGTAEPGSVPNQQPVLPTPPGGGSPPPGTPPDGAGPTAGLPLPPLPLPGTPAGPPLALPPGGPLGEPPGPGNPGIPVSVDVTGGPGDPPGPGPADAPGVSAVTPNVVPEPQTWSLVALGLGTLAAVGRRRGGRGDR